MQRLGHPLRQFVGQSAATWSKSWSQRLSQPFPQDLLGSYINANAFKLYCTTRFPFILPPFCLYKICTKSVPTPQRSRAPLFDPDFIPNTPHFVSETRSFNLANVPLYSKFFPHFVTSLYFAFLVLLSKCGLTDR
jgi:hypothetical protein